MTTVIDQTNDPGYSRLRVLTDKFPTLKEFSKTANIAEDEFEKLADSAFAWPAQRKFPVHNKEHAALSIAYRKLASNVPATVDAELNKAAELYGIEKDIYVESPTEKTASEEYWLLPEKSRYRVASADDVKYAETALRHKYAELTIEDRAQTFSRLGVAAKRHDVTLSPSTYKLAGFTVTSTRTLKDYMDARSAASGDTPIGRAFSKIAQEFAGKAAMWNDRQLQIKLASTIHGLDKEAGIDKYYGTKLPDPMLTVFNTEKIAEDQVSLGADFMMDKSKLAALPLDFWKDLLGDDIAAEISTDGQTVNPEALYQLLPTLPADLMAIAQKQLAAYR